MKCKHGEILHGNKCIKCEREKLLENNPQLKDPEFIKDLFKENLKPVVDDETLEHPYNNLSTEDTLQTFTSSDVKDVLNTIDSDMAETLSTLFRLAPGLPLKEEEIMGLLGLGMKLCLNAVSNIEHNYEEGKRTVLYSVLLTKIDELIKDNTISGTPKSLQDVAEDNITHALSMLNMPQK